MKTIKRVKIMYRLFSMFLTLFLLVFAVEASALQNNVLSDEGADVIVSEVPEVRAEKADTIKFENKISRSSLAFTPVTEELLPLKTRIISISVRNAPLKDVLFAVGENTGLNIIMETGVNPELPMTITLKEVAADEALDIIFSSIDYFYDLEGNVLIVRVMATRMFEFGHPSIAQEYSSDVGGDLFGATDDISNIKGGVKQSIKADSASLNLWDSLEATLKGVVGTGTIDINRMSGTILVTATKKNMIKVDNYLTKLREVLSRRVLVEARIVEVTLTDNLKYGINWAFLDNFKGVGQVVAGSINQDNQLVSGTIDPLDFGINTAVQDTGFFVATLGNDFSAIISALDEQGDTTVLSNPRLGIMNGQTALLNVGRKTDYVSEVDSTVEQATTDNPNPATTYDVTTKSVLSGVMLGIVPNINENGEVTLTITPIVSDLVDLKEHPFGDVTKTGYSISLPIIDLKELSTVVKVRDGEMIVLGGHIDKTEGVEDKQVPFLGDIPYLGYLFKQHAKTHQSKELVILLKATVDKVGL
ncbi:MAG: pilus (MSHA type) biogenesis protein MshL [Thermodesulfovibrionia bacterium]|nr:pilus (MSHA type) biogenesis protein MshL [Thermodesulfovibrionia bacterium]